MIINYKKNINSHQISYKIKDKSEIISKIFSVLLI